jgi:signal transduction histidine kinase
MRTLNNKAYHFVIVILLFLIVHATLSYSKDSMNVQGMYNFAAKSYNTDSGYKTSIKLYKLAKATNNTKLQAKALYLQTQYWYPRLSKNEYIAKTKPVMRWLLSTRNLDEYYIIWYNIIQLHLLDCDIKQSIDEIHKLKYILKRNPNNMGEAICYRIQGDLYFTFRSYHAAIQYYEMERQYDNLANPLMAGDSYFSRAKCEFLLSHREVALSLALKARELAIDENDIANDNLIIAIIYHMSGDNFMFMKYYHLFLDYKRTRKLDTKTLHNYYVAEASRCCIEHKPDSAVKFLLQTNDMTRSSMLPFLYKHLGKSEEAFNALNRLNGEMDSLTSNLLVKGFEDSDTKFENAKLAKYQTALINELSKERENRNVFFIITLLVLLIGTACGLTVVIMTLRKSNRIIAEQNKSKDKFIQDMSHEIRTPLNAINGFVPIITHQGSDIVEQEKMKIVEIIENSTKQLTVILDNMLMLSELDSGRLTLSISDVSPLSICDQAVRTLKDKVGERDISLEYNVPADIKLHTDKNRIVAIIEELLINACNFSPTGKITLNCYRTSAADNIVFTVSDHGCGIPENMSEEIFHRFVKVDNFKPGIGVGLTIAYKVADMLGAKLYVDNTYKEGARLILEHPLTQEKQQA